MRILGRTLYGTQMIDLQTHLQVADPESLLYQLSRPEETLNYGLNAV